MDDEAVTYTVVVTREEDGRYTAFLPSLHECASFGDTLPEALRRVEEAAGLFITTLRERAWPVPEDDPRVALDMTDTAEGFVYGARIRIADLAAC